MNDLYSNEWSSYNNFFRPSQKLIKKTKIKSKEIMYGVNTGIGEFSELVLNDEQVKEFQKYLIYNQLKIKSFLQKNRYVCNLNK